MTIPNHRITILEAEGGPQLRDLFSFAAAGRTFAVFAEEVEATAEQKRPAPLPNAPAAVLGIVSIRGRMMTVLDPVAMVTGNSETLPIELPVVVALRGDEQLALAAESLCDTVTILATDIQAIDDSDGNAVIAGVARHAGEEITVLDTKHLFFAAVQRKERRRRRF